MKELGPVEGRGGMYQPSTEFYKCKFWKQITAISYVLL